MRRERRPLLRPTRRRRPVPPRARARRLRCRLRRDPDAALPATTSSPRRSTALRNLDHRGAAGAEPDSGDGAGHPASQVPDAFLREPSSTSSSRRPGRTPSAPRSCPATSRARRRRPAADRGDRRRGGPAPSSAGARSPIAADLVGADRPRACMPVLPPALRRRQPAPRLARHRRWSGWPSACASAPSARPTSTSRRCRRARSSTRACSPPTSSSRSSPTSSDERVRVGAGARALALLDQHLPVSWPLAHPFRFIAHNGEINTVHGQPQLDARPRGAARQSDLFGGDLERLFPICTPGGSDSASFDEVARAAAPGRPLAAARGADDDPRGVGEPRRRWTPSRRAFYEYHSALMEPWDGPASSPSPTAPQIGAVLDRNGLRPSRYWVTDDGLVVLASEVGVLDIDPANVVAQGAAAAGPDVPRRHRRGPHHRGRGDQGRARRRAPVRRVAARRPDPPRRPRPSASTSCTRTPRSPGASRSSATPRRSCASCWPRWPAPAREPIGSMGTDTPARGALATGRGCSSTTSSSSSRR